MRRRVHQVRRYWDYIFHSDFFFFVIEQKIIFQYILFYVEVKVFYVASSVLPNVYYSTH